MKQKLLNKLWLRVGMIVAIMTTALSGTAWATSDLYVFNTLNWGDSSSEWTSGQGGNQFTSGRGVQVTTGKSGANATTNISFSNVSEVVVTYSTNASAGAGSISIQVGSNTAVSQNVTKTGGTTDRTLTYSFSPAQTGAVKIAVTCTTNSIYVKSVKITYTSGGDTPTPTTYTVTYDANGATSGSVPTDNTSYNANASVTVLGNTGSLAKTDYTFAGWNTAADGTGTDYAEGATFTISANTTLYAQWTENNSSEKKITITEDNLADFTNTYGWYSWAAGGVSGQAYAYKNSGMQFNSSKSGYWIYNTSAIPGIITSVKMVKASGTDRSWTLKAGTSEITTTSGGTQIGEAKTVGTSGATWDVSGTYNYFLLYVSGGSTVIGSIEITYIPSTDPVINADDVNVAYDATEGSFSYTINNPVQDGSVSIDYDSEGNWLLSATENNGTVSFTCEANTTDDERLAVVEITYTYNTNETVTKDVLITQAAAPVTPPTPVSGKYVKVTSTDDLTDGQYLIVYEEGSVAFDGGLETLDAVGNTIAVTISNNEIAATSTTTAAEFTIDVTAGTIKSASGEYIFASTYNNELKTSTSVPEKTNTFSFNSGDAVISVSVTETQSVTLRYNSASNQTRFRYYKSGQEAIQLYKKVVPTESVKLNASGYATFSSNYAVSIPADGAFTAWQITNIDSDNKITFVQVTGNVKAETGLFLKGDESDEITIEVAASGEELTDNKLVGFPNATNVADNEYYGLSGNQFVKVTAGAVKAGKALLPAHLITESNSVKPFTFVFEDDATGIEETLSNSPLKGENIYNLAGQMVNGKSVNGKLPKGIYIVNGKKVMVK